jgi:hypothetical protein
MLKVDGYLLLLPCIQNSILYAQEWKVKILAHDEIVIVCSVDNRDFSNFTAPNINLAHKNSKFILNALPSLRYKKTTQRPKVHS